MSPSRSPSKFLEARPLIAKPTEDHDEDHGNILGPSKTCGKTRSTPSASESRNQMQVVSRSQTLMLPPRTSIPINEKPSSGVHGGRLRPLSLLGFNTVTKVTRQQLSVRMPVKPSCFMSRSHLSGHRDEAPVSYGMWTRGGRFDNICGSLWQSRVAAVILILLQLIQVFLTYTTTNCYSESKYVNRSNVWWRASAANCYLV